MTRYIWTGIILLLICGGGVTGSDGWMSIPDWVVNHQNEQLSMYGDHDFYSMIGGMRQTDNQTVDWNHGRVSDTISPAAIDSLANQAEESLQSGSYEEALRQYSQILNIDPSSFTAHYGRGKALEGLNRDDDALTAYQDAISSADRSSSPVWKAYAAEGMIFFRQDRSLKAVEALDHAIELSTGISLSGGNADELQQIFKIKGDALTALGQDGKAEEAYQKAEELGSG